MSGHLLSSSAYLSMGNLPTTLIMGRLSPESRTWLARSGGAVEEGQEAGSSFSGRILWEGGGLLVEENKDRFSSPMDNDIVIVGVKSEQKDKQSSPKIRTPH